MTAAIVSLRERCVQLFGEQTADRVLVEVAAWLNEVADARDAEAAEYGVQSGLSLIAASDAGVMRGLATAVVAR